MSELNDLIQQALLEKQTKIIPENIKKGVTAFGIEGALEAGASGEVPVKLFGTVEEMNSSTDNEIDDLALVYSEQISNITSSIEFQVAQFPQIVTLPSAFTEDVYGMFRAVDSSMWFNAQVELGQTYFRFSYYGDSSNGEVSYTSEDGITYTRTDSLGNPVDFGTAIKCYYEDYWNDAFGYFIQAAIYNFGGVFTYEPYKDTDNVRYIYDIRNNAGVGEYSLSDNDDYFNMTELTTILERIRTEYLNSISMEYFFVTKTDTSLDIYCSINKKTDGTLSHSYMDNLLEYSDGRFGIGATFLLANKPTTSVGYHFSVVEDTITFEELSMTTVKEVSSDGYWAFGKIPENSKIVNIRYNYGTYELAGFSILFYSISSISAINEYRDTTKYLPAPNQLTLSQADQLWNGVSAFGTAGVIEGSIPTPTLYSSNQLLPDVSAINTNRKLITGDGSIYKNMPDIQTKNSQIYVNGASYEVSDILPSALIASSNSYIQIGDYLYVFGYWISGSTMNPSYKYNIRTKQYVEITRPPFTNNSQMNCPNLVAYETDIYIFSGNMKENGTQAFKYDTITETYTRLADLPVSAKSLKGVAVDNKIYLFWNYEFTSGGTGTTLRAYTYVYDTTTNTYAKLADRPLPEGKSYVGTIHCAVYLQNKLIVGYTASATGYIYEYDIVNDTYIYLQRSADMQNTAVTDNDDRICFFSTTAGYNFTYIVSTNETLRHPIVRGATNNSVASPAITIDNKIYVLDTTNLVPIYFKSKDITYLDVPSQQELIWQDIQANLLPENIKAGVTILGVTGTYTTSYDGTITPEEYDTALETAQEIEGGI